MNIKQAERLFGAKVVETYKANMVGVTHQIERRKHGQGYSYCVSTYVSNQKSSEHWPAYRGGRRYGGQNSNGSQRWYGEDFLATETMNGQPI